MIVRECLWQDFDRRLTSEVLSVARYTWAMPPAPQGADYFVRTDASTNGERHQFAGTRRFSSSSQFCTTTTCGDATASLESLLTLTITNRWPSGETS